MSEELDIEEMNNIIKMLDEIDDNDVEPNYSSIIEQFGLDLEELEFAMDSYSPTIDLEYTKSNTEATSPKYAYDSDSGFDLHSTEELWIDSMDRRLVPTGLHMNIPEGYEIQVRSKSGLALKQGLMVLNSPGTVDCFSEDMKILTVSGEKTINEIKIGEIIYSFNEKTLEIEKDVISKIVDTEKQDILLIETDNGILEVTPNSEVYTTKGVVFAKDLKEDDEIISFF